MPKNVFSEPGIKTGITICKALMRNGYDAYPINAQLQMILCEKTGRLDVDIACAEIIKSLLYGSAVLGYCLRLRCGSAGQAGSFHPARTRR